MTTVIFVCQRNRGKSQMAASVLRKLALPDLSIVSAGTQPGEGLNAESVAALQSRGYRTDGEYPKPLTAELAATADLVVFLGRQAQFDLPETVAAERWDTVEPSHDGIEGPERMALILDDIERRVHDLADRLTA